MNESAHNPTPILGRRSPVELGLVVTLIAGTIAATSAFIDVRQRLDRIESHQRNTWTATHQHLWIEMAGDRIETGDELPNVHDVQQVYANLLERDR